MASRETTNHMQGQEAPAATCASANSAADATSQEQEKPTASRQGNAQLRRRRQLHPPATACKPAPTRGFLLRGQCAGCWRRHCTGAQSASLPARTSLLLGGRHWRHAGRHATHSGRHTHAGGHGGQSACAGRLGEQLAHLFEHTQHLRSNRVDKKGALSSWRKTRGNSWLIFSNTRSTCGGREPNKKMRQLAKRGGRAASTGAWLSPM